MASEIRVNQIQNRSGLSTVTFSDTGVVIAGITTVTTLNATNITGTLTGNVNSTSGVTTVTTLNATSIVGVATAGITTAYIGSVNDGPISGARNRIINGSFDIWQRGTGVSVPASTYTYTSDRWVVINGLSSSGIMTTSQSSSAPTGFLYSYKFQRPSSSTSTGTANFFQVIESINCYDLAGQKVTLSFWCKAGANFSASSINAVVYTGTVSNQGSSNLYSWTGLSSPINYSITPTTTWTKYTVSGTISSSILEMSVAFNSGTFTGTAGADDSVYITGVQLEVGPTATPFERRSYGQELALCRRYYKKGLAITGNSGQTIFGSHYGGSNGTNIFDIDMPSFRTAPNLSLLNNSNVQYYSYGGAWTASTAAITSQGTWPNSWIYIYASADGDGRGKLFRCTNATDIHWVADAEL
jgi:hypothetical protein